MSNYRITQFTNSTGTVKWNMTANENIFRHSTNQSTRHFMSFLSQDTYKPSKVMRIIDNIEFELGVSRIKRPAQIGNMALTSIIIEPLNGKLLLNGIPFESIILVHAQTAPIPVQPVVQQPVQTLPGQTNDDWFLALQNRIIASYPRAIRLEKTLRNRKAQTLKDFIKIFFTEWNGNDKNFDDKDDFKDTIYVDDHSVQTDWGKRRSIGDIFMICKYYYPNCTLKQVYQILLIDLHNEITDGFRTSKCTTINKRVWYYDNENDTAQLDLNTPDEYGNTIAIYKQKLA